MLKVEYYTQNIQIKLPENFDNLLKSLSTNLKKNINVNSFTISYIYNSLAIERLNITNEKSYKKFLNALYKHKAEKIEVKIGKDNNYKENKDDDEENKDDDEENKIIPNPVNITINDKIIAILLQENEEIKEDNINKFIEFLIKTINEKEKKMNYSYGIDCGFCLHNEIKGILYYCKDCNKFFCSDCERNIGQTHPHCYYKIRDEEQFKILKDSYLIIYLQEKIQKGKNYCKEPIRKFISKIRTIFFGDNSKNQNLNNINNNFQDNIINNIIEEN